MQYSFQKWLYFGIYAFVCLDLTNLVQRQTIKLFLKISFYELRIKHRRWRLFLSLFIASKGHQSQWFMARSVNVWCCAEVPLNELILNINQDHIWRAELVNGSLCLMTTFGDNPVRMTSRILKQSVGMTSSPSTSSHVEMTKNAQNFLLLDDTTVPTLNPSVIYVLLWLAHW